MVPAARHQLPSARRVVCRRSPRSVTPHHETQRRPSYARTFAVAPAMAALRARGPQLSISLAVCAVLHLIYHAHYSFLLCPCQGGGTVLFSLLLVSAPEARLLRTEPLKGTQRRARSFGVPSHSNNKQDASSVAHPVGIAKRNRGEHPRKLVPHLRPVRTVHHSRQDPPPDSL